jgi:NADPH:quinone reductase-like Zn-dependent oxidoreductase
MEWSIFPMKAIRIHAFGGPENLRYEEAPQPIPANDEVLIRVHAAGVNPVDAKIRAGEFSRFRPQLPAILGRDISGFVADVGKEVSGLAKGGAVFGMLDYDRGAYAEYVVASIREIAPAPDALDYQKLAALPVAALTAWQALFEHGKLRRGQRVLIHAANGGVGHLAVQLALWCGAEVVGTCAEEDVDFVRHLGAGTVIDYKAQRFEDQVRNVDLVLDLVAGETRQRSWKVLKPGGILVSTLPGPKPEDRRDVSGREVVVYPAPVQLQTIARLLATRAINVAIDRVFSLAEVHAAHRHLEKEHSRGKTVVQIG